MTLRPEDESQEGSPNQPPELSRIEDDDTLNLAETILLRGMLDVSENIPDALYYAPNGKMHYNLRPLTLDTASLRTQLHGGWGPADLTNGKPVIEELLYKAGYSLEHKPLVHNVILFAPRHHGRGEGAVPDRLTSTAVGFLRNRGIVAADGKFLLINPPTFYDLTVRTIAMMYPPIKGQITSVTCNPADTDEVINALEHEMAKPNFNEWLNSVAPTGKLLFPKMK